MAAVAGVNPYSESLTPQDLFWMAQAKSEERWDHTASLMMMQHNSHAEKPKSMIDFHPFRQKKVVHTGKKGELTGTELYKFRSFCKNWKGD